MLSIHRELGNHTYSIYAYEYAGVDPATGKELYYINGEDGSRETTTNSAQANKTIIGSVEPTVQGGLTNFVSWKFIDFNMTLTYSLGAMLMTMRLGCNLTEVHIIIWVTYLLITK